MTKATEQHGKNNIIIGAGEFYLVDLDGDDNPIGERYLGDSIGGSLTITPETASVFSGDGEVAETLAQVITQITRTFSVTLHDMSPDNLALFTLGDVGTQTETASEVAAEIIRIGKLDRWYPLGLDSTSAPAGVMAVDKTVEIRTGADSSKAKAASKLTNTSNADYVLDADHARVYVKSGGTVKAGEIIAVKYTPVARKTNQVLVDENKQIRAGLRYIETSAFPGGIAGNNYYAPLCNITPSGEAQFKSPGRNTEQQIQIAAEVLAPASGPSLVINGQKAA